MALIKTVESTKNIDQLMRELGFEDIAEQSIWTHHYGGGYISIQATLGETEKHQDLWWLTIFHISKKEFEISNPSLGFILTEYFKWLIAGVFK